MSVDELVHLFKAKWEYSTRTIYTSLIMLMHFWYISSAISCNCSLSRGYSLFASFRIHRIKAFSSASDKCLLHFVCLCSRLPSLPPCPQSCLSHIECFCYGIDWFEFSVMQIFQCCIHSRIISCRLFASLPHHWWW